MDAKYKGFTVHHSPSSGVLWNMEVLIVMPRQTECDVQIEYTRRIIIWVIMIDSLLNCS